MEKIRSIWNGIPPILRNILSAIIGIVVGGQLNMFIVKISPRIFPLPEGVNVEDIQSIAAHIQEYEPKHLLMPFIAHALGTFAAAYIACKLAASHQFRIALTIGCLFLIGGLMAVYMIPNSPMWFNALDIVLAYIPMAYIGYRLTTRK